VRRFVAWNCTKIFVLGLSLERTNRSPPPFYIRLGFGWGKSSAYVYRVGSSHYESHVQTWIGASGSGWRSTDTSISVEPSNMFRIVLLVLLLPAAEDVAIALSSTVNSMKYLKHERTSRNTDRTRRIDRWEPSYSVYYDTTRHCVGIHNGISSRSHHGSCCSNMGAQITCTHSTTYYRYDNYACSSIITSDVKHLVVGSGTAVVWLRW
jgi:hypothetical protein